MSELYSNYRVLEPGCSWGIWIQISGKIENGSGVGIQVSENILFQNKIKNINLSIEQNEYIEEGLKWIGPYLGLKVKEPTILIIEEITLILTDYQIEGLFYAVAFWVCEQFEIEMPSYEINFDRSVNKYLFPDLKILGQ